MTLLLPVLKEIRLLPMSVMIWAAGEKALFCKFPNDGIILKVSIVHGIETGAKMTLLWAGFSLFLWKSILQLLI